MNVISKELPWDAGGAALKTHTLRTPVVVVKSFATQSVVHGPAASPGSLLANVSQASPRPPELETGFN